MEVQEKLKLTGASIPNSQRLLRFAALCPITCPTLAYSSCSFDYPSPTSFQQRSFSRGDVLLLSHCNATRLRTFNRLAYKYDSNFSKKDVKSSRAVSTTLSVDSTELRFDECLTSQAHTHTHTHTHTTLYNKLYNTLYKLM